MDCFAATTCGVKTANAILTTGLRITIRSFCAATAPHNKRIHMSPACPNKFGQACAGDPQPRYA